MPSVSLIDAVAKKQKTLLLANPHSSLPASANLTQTLVQETRVKVLELFNTNSEHYEVVFVANATAAAKLVFDTFRDLEEGFDYLYHRDCHTSLVGGRELAYHHLCFDRVDEMKQWWNRHGSSDSQGADGRTRPTLCAYPAQSNMNGRRLPLTLARGTCAGGEDREMFVLLDAAAHVSTSPIDLSDEQTAPDFLTLSFYKIFGFPNLGALLVRRAAGYIFEKRRYFGGGTTDMITCRNEAWVAKKKGLHEGLEDGSGASHSILALNCAIDIHKKMFGGLEQVSKHTGWLAGRLYDELVGMKHANGRRVCVMYKDAASAYGDATSQGGIVAFNVRGPDGVYFDTTLVGNEAMARNIHVRAGSMCNPGGMADGLGLSDGEVRRLYDRGLRCGLGSNKKGVPLGMVRASFGACSTLEDVRVLVQFLREAFVDRLGDRVEAASLSRRSKWWVSVTLVHRKLDV